MTTSPFTRRALSRQLPAADYTGRLSAMRRWDAQPDALDMGTERITVGPSRRSFTVADLQRRVGRNA